MLGFQQILDHCTKSFKGVQQNHNWGEKAIFYNPEVTLKKGVYVLTVKEKDGENDNASRVNRDGVYRINIGIKKERFIKMFSTLPKRPPAGGIVDMDYDFSKLDTIMPHPVYGWMGWICVLSPSKETFQKLKPLIEEAYIYAKEKYAKRKNT